jgi:hypothetical protein
MGRGKMDERTEPLHRNPYMSSEEVFARGIAWDNPAQAFVFERITAPSKGSS